MNKDLGLHRLLAITKDCRPDMHEPDEQGLKAWVIGNHLDNAFGNQLVPDLLKKGSHEFVIFLERFDGEKIINEAFNLSSLIALARQAPKRPSEE